MGEVAEMMMEGVLCEGCGSFIDDDPPGHPRRCGDCNEGDEGEILPYPDCGPCDGSGRTNVHGGPNAPCPDCGGTGKEQEPFFRTRDDARQT